MQIFVVILLLCSYVDAEPVIPLDDYSSTVPNLSDDNILNIVDMPYDDADNVDEMTGLCPSGKYQDNYLNCIDCPADKYQDQQGQLTCKNCPIGKFLEFDRWDNDHQVVQHTQNCDTNEFQHTTKEQCKGDLPNCCAQRTHLCTTKPCFLLVDGTNEVKDVEKYADKFPYGCFEYIYPDETEKVRVWNENGKQEIYGQITIGAEFTNYAEDWSTISESICDKYVQHVYPRDSEDKCNNCDNGKFLSTDKLECNTCPLGWSSTSFDATCDQCLDNQYQDDQTKYACKNCTGGKQIVTKFSYGLRGDEKCHSTLTEIECRQFLPDCCAGRTHLCETKPCFLSIDGTQSVKDVEIFADKFPLGCFEYTYPGENEQVRVWNQVGNVDVCGTVSIDTELTEYADVWTTDAQCLCKTYENNLRDSVDDCISCEIGKYSVSGGSCAICPIGEYQNKIGIDECKKCPVGKFLPRTTADNHNSLDDCITCADGQYQDQTGQGSCKECVVGKFHNINANDVTDRNKESDCNICPVGQYQEETAKLECKDCPVGKYLPQTTVDNHDSLSDCIECEIGKYQYQVGQGLCTICEAGQYQDQTAKTNCTMCQEGKYISDGKELEVNEGKLIQSQNNIWKTVGRDVTKHDSPDDCKQCKKKASHDRTVCNCLNEDGSLENINPYDEDPQNSICACETLQNSLFCDYSKTQYCYNEDGETNGVDHLRCEENANTKPVCDTRIHVIQNEATFATWENKPCPSSDNIWQYKQQCNPENEINKVTCFCSEDEICSVDQYCITSENITYCSKFPKCPDNSGRMSAKTDELGEVVDCVCSFNNVCGSGRNPRQESCFTDGKCLQQRDCNSGGLAFQNSEFTSCKCNIPGSQSTICEGVNYCYDISDSTEQGCKLSAPEDCSYTDGYTPNNQNELCLCRKSSTNEAVWCTQEEPYCNNECDDDDDCSSLPPSCSVTQNPTCKWIYGDDGSGNTYTDTPCSCGGELCQKNQYCDVSRGENKKCHNRFCKDYISGAQQNDLCQRDGYGNGLLEGNPQCSADTCLPAVDYVTCCKECPPEQQAPFGKCRSMCMDSVCDVKTWTTYTTSEEHCDDIHTKEDCENAAAVLLIEFINVTSVDSPHGCFKNIDDKIMWNTNGSEYCNTGSTKCVCVQNKNMVENWVWKRPDPKLTTDAIQSKYAEYEGICYGDCTEESDILRCCIQSKKCEDQNVDDLGCAMETKYTRNLTNALCKNFKCTREECCESKECTCTGGTPSDFRDCPQEGDEHCAECNITSYKENNICLPITHCNSTEFEEEAPTSLSNRVCKMITECASEQWISRIPTDTEDRVCSDWSVCAEGEYEILSGSLQEDRKCSTQNTCAYDQYLLVTDETPIGTCKNLTTCGPEQWISKNHTTKENRNCSDWDICQEEEYQKIHGSLYQNRECAVPTECAERIKNNYTTTSDRECADWTICNQNEYEKSAPDKISNTDRICEKIKLCTSSQYQKTAATQFEDAVCETIKICDHNLGEYEKTPPTDMTDRICDTCIAVNNNTIPGCIGCMTRTDCNYDKKAKIHHENTILTGDICSAKNCTFINVSTDSSNDYMTFEPIIDRDNALIYGENYRFDIKTPGDNATFVGTGITFVKEREEVLTQVTFDNYVYFNIPQDNIEDITYYETVQSGWKFSVKRNCQYTETLLRENSCTSECGRPGSEIWKRKITQEPFNGGTPCPEDLFISKPCVNPTYKCPINCVYEENTSPKSNCDAECGKTGKKLTREIIIKVLPQWDGTACPENETSECYSSPPTGDCDCNGTKYDHCGVCGGKDLCKGCDGKFYSSYSTHKDYESEQNLYVGGTKPFVNKCGQCNPSTEENEKCSLNNKFLESSKTTQSQFQEKFAPAVFIVGFITFIIVMFVYICWPRKQYEALPTSEQKRENKSDILDF